MKIAITSDEMSAQETLDACKEVLSDLEKLIARVDSIKAEGTRYDFLTWLYFDLKSAYETFSVQLKSWSNDD